MVTFRVSDMTCGCCAQALAAAVAGVEGSTEVVIDIARKLVQVGGNAATADVASAIQKAGYTPEKVAWVAPDAEQRAPGSSCGGRRRAAVEVGHPGRRAGASCCG